MKSETKSKIWSAIIAAAVSLLTSIAQIFSQVINAKLMKFIEWLLRNNVKFTVTSAFRTEAENEACGGSKNSQHLTGDAIDLKPLDFSLDNFILKIKNSGFEFDQLIKYRTFVHISFTRLRKPRLMELDFTDRK